MSFDAARLLELLPAVYRVRDAELAGQVANRLSAAEEAELAVLEAAGEGVDPTERRRRDALRARRDRGPLASLLSILAGEIAAIEENLEQLYDDQFIETCAPWAVPYIGDLIGYRTLHGRAPRIGSRRAEVAHTIAFRRRKGTATMLEQLARDVTGWNARVVEFFDLLATTQYMNHTRLHNRVAPDLRDGDALERIGTAFDTVPRSLEVRRIASRRGRYNVPNIGIFLWRLDAHRLELSPAVRASGDAAERRFRIHPLGIDATLCTRPQIEDEIAHLAEPINVPAPITRRVLHRHRSRYYGAGRSLQVLLDGEAVAQENIVSCNLSDDGVNWAHDAPAGFVAVDPLLGRLVVAADLGAPAEVRVTHHYPAPGEIGGGEYPRAVTFASPSGTFLRVPDDHATIQAALDALEGAGIVEIRDNSIYREALTVNVAAARGVELRAMDGRRPTLVLTAPLRVEGGPGSAFSLNGLVIAGDVIEVPAGGNGLRTVSIVHATLVPGHTLAPDGAPTQPGATSLLVAAADAHVSLTRCISGGVRISAQSVAELRDCILDVHATDARAFAAPGAAAGHGGAVTIEACTVIGETRTVRLEASNSMLLGNVDARRRQEGCVRFSYLPAGSRAPRRYRCQPEPGAETTNVPGFTTLRYGHPGYAQLSSRTSQAIARGAEDESEMGAYHFLYQAQREADLSTRLDEYLRIALEAGVFHEN